MGTTVVLVGEIDKLTTSRSTMPASYRDAKEIWPSGFDAGEEGLDCLLPFAKTELGH